MWDGSCDVKYMSDHRQPIAVFSCKFAGKDGKKTGEKRLIEIFAAKDFARAWEPTGKAFSPRPPLRDSDRIVFWQTYYRVRLNGKWLADGARYTLFTREELIARFINFPYQQQGCSDI